MPRLLIALLFGFALILASSSAQEVKKEDKIKEVDPPKTTPAPLGKAGAPPAIPGDCEVHFLNGSKVRMIVQSEKLEVSTAYGRLSVPIKDVRAIEFGLHFPEGLETKIDAAIKSLGNTDYREREKADKALMEMATYSYPAVIEAGQNSDSEVSKRAKDLVQRIRAKHPKKDLKVTIDDRVVTQHFTIVGRILTTTVKAKTEYFGEQEINIAKMRSLRSMGAVSLDTELSVDASKYANRDQWLDTGYHCDGRTAIHITATGLIDVWPQQGGGFMSGPAGFQHTRNGGGPGNVLKGGRKLGLAITPQAHCGMLIGKIGEDGEFFLVADRFEGVPEGEGKLYLTIGPSQWNAQCVGAFEVKINRKTD
ncbi:MAG: hypothetical protein HYR84_05670 [Planctomycetes bacterium]|nr:hypothetical protein [Planctomycetota bacterium]